MGLRDDVVAELRKIDNVGASRADKLYEAGVRSVLDVSLLTPSAVTEILGTNEAGAVEIITSASGLVSEDRTMSAMDTSPVVGTLPEVPVDDLAVDIAREEKFTMLAAAQKTPVRKAAGALRRVLVCRLCYVIKAHPNPKLNEKRPRYGELQPGMISSGLVCDCKSRGTFSLGVHPTPGLAKKIVDQQRNAIIFARFAV